MSKSLTSFNELVESVFPSFGAGAEITLTAATNNAVDISDNCYSAGVSKSASQDAPSCWGQGFSKQRVTEWLVERCSS